FDVDVIVDRDAQDAAKRIARAARGTAFELSEAWGAWRVIAPGHPWQVDIMAIRGGSLDADLRLRDFTINAIAHPLDGGDVVDPLGGRADLEAGVLRMVAQQAFADDPLRVLRLARLACELRLTVDEPTIAAARAHAPQVADVAQERVFAELKR